MTSTIHSFEHLSDDELLATVKGLTATECRATAALVRSLMELDVRRLYLGEGYSSLFTYCTQALHLAEGAAYNRIEAARTARRFPAVLMALEEGAVTLTTVRLVAPHLTTANHQDVLASARHKGKRQVEELVASLRPLPAVPSTIRKLPEPRQVVLAANFVEPTSTDAASSPRAVAAAINTSASPTVTPLAPERYKLQFTISCETHAKLRRVQALSRHVIPSGDPAEIFDRALTLLLQDRRVRCPAPVSQGRAAQSIVPKAPISAITGEQVDVLPCETRDPLAYLCAAETLGAGGSAVQVRPEVTNGSSENLSETGTVKRNSTEGGSVPPRSPTPNGP